MKLVPFLIIAACLAWAGYRREWFDLAWTAELLVLVGFDSITSAIRASTSAGSDSK